MPPELQRLKTQAMQRMTTIQKTKLLETRISDIVFNPLSPRTPKNEPDDISSSEVELFEDVDPPQLPQEQLYVTTDLERNSLIEDLIKNQKETENKRGSGLFSRPLVGYEISK